MSGQIPVPDLRKLGHHVFGGVDIKDGHAEGHLHQNTGEAGPPQLVQQRQVGSPLHLGPGVKDDGSVRGIGRGEDGQAALDLNVLAAGQYIQGRILCPVVVGYIPEKSGRQKKHRQQDTRGQPQPLPVKNSCDLHKRATSHLL